MHPATNPKRTEVPQRADIVVVALSLSRLSERLRHRVAGRCISRVVDWRISRVVDRRISRVVDRSISPCIPSSRQMYISVLQTGDKAESWRQRAHCLGKKTLAVRSPDYSYAWRPYPRERNMILGQICFSVSNSGVWHRDIYLCNAFSFLFFIFLFCLSCFLFKVESKVISSKLQSSAGN